MIAPLNNTVLLAVGRGLGGGGLNTQAKRKPRVLLDSWGYSAASDTGYVPRRCQSRIWLKKEVVPLFAVWTATSSLVLGSVITIKLAPFGAGRVAGGGSGARTGSLLKLRRNCLELSAELCDFRHCEGRTPGSLKVTEGSSGPGLRGPVLPPGVCAVPSRGPHAQTFSCGCIHLHLRFRPDKKGACPILTPHLLSRFPPPLPLPPTWLEFLQRRTTVEFVLGDIQAASSTIPAPRRPVIGVARDADADDDDDCRAHGGFRPGVPISHGFCGGFTHGSL
ncbi:hypothetical protein HPB47_021081 [Ixodes persulcatus]|uniref:Uncharacterized protein n=1 Tax=Ixodes persulcatus TaxID=34615 RepID=A0AC60QFS0_IXOPE|nr:hypothetical protein HPB47_021081 [Ixodes persulcatus]